MADDADDRSGMVQAPLSQDEWEKRSAKLAAEEIEREQVRADKRSHNAACNDRIRELNKSIRVLAEEVETRMAWVPAQTDMFDSVDDVSDDDEDVAEEAPDPEPEPQGRRRRRRAANANGIGDAA